MIDPRITAAFEQDNGFPLEPHLVVLALMGSHSHGTYLPPEEPNAVDDIDLMGFVVPPLELLRARRDVFSSQEAAESFAGYASDQLKRMEAFDLERMTEYEGLTGIIGAKGPLREVLEADAQKLKHISINWSISHAELTRFRKLHREHFSGYMGEKRKAMVRKYQYDVKNAAHLIRLLRMGAEFIEAGTLQVYRTTDADELKVIKRGGWTLEQVKAEADRLFQLVEEARRRSTLPQEPDAEAANALLMELHRRILL